MAPLPSHAHRPVAGRRPGIPLMAAAYDFTSAGSTRVPGARKNRTLEKREVKTVDVIVSGLTHMTGKQLQAVAHLLAPIPGIQEDIAIAARLPRSNQARKRQEGLIAKKIRDAIDAEAQDKLAAAVALAEDTQALYEDSDIQYLVDAWKEQLIGGEQERQTAFKELLDKAARYGVDLTAQQLSQLVRQYQQSLDDERRGATAASGNVSTAATYTGQDQAQWPGSPGSIAASSSLAGSIDGSLAGYAGSSAAGSATNHSTASNTGNNAGSSTSNGTGSSAASSNTAGSSGTDNSGSSSSSGSSGDRFVGSSAAVRGTDGNGGSSSGGSDGSPPVGAPAMARVAGAAVGTADRDTSDAELSVLLQEVGSLAPLKPRSKRAGKARAGGAAMRSLRQARQLADNALCRVLKQVAEREVLAG